MSRFHDIDNQSSFWGHFEAPEVLPVRDPRQARCPYRSRQRRADREAGAQRSLPLRLREVVSKPAAWSRAAMMARTAPTTF